MGGDMGPTTPQKTDRGDRAEKIRRAHTCGVWHSYWGVSRQVAEIYQRMVKDIAAAGSEPPLDIGLGPVRLVWDEFHFDVQSIKECLAECNRQIEARQTIGPERITAILRWSLGELLTIPVQFRETMPRSYGGGDPAQHPPADWLIMERI
jgi:hypothetical protein